MDLKDRQVTTDSTRRAVHCVEREAMQTAESGSGVEWGGDSKGAEFSSVTQAKNGPAISVP